MRKVLPWMSLLILITLVGCNAIGGKPSTNKPVATATLSPDQIQTQINQMLTLLPANTAQPQQETTPTVALPTVPVDTPAGEETPVVVTETPAEKPTATAEADVVEATATTEAPTAEAPTATKPAATATQSSGPTVTPVPGDPRTRLGNATDTDPMDNATKWIWPTGFDKYTSGKFSDGKQLVTALTGTDGWRVANPAGREFSNLYLEAKFQTGTCSGSDHYGLFTRIPVLTDPDRGYLLGFTCDGRYSLRRWNANIGTKGEMKWLVNWTANSAINSGSNQTNRMGFMMVGSRLLLYANGQLLTEVKDTNFASGYFGVFVGSDVTDQLAVKIDEMSYWENPQP